MTRVRGHRGSVYDPEPDPEPSTWRIVWLWLLFLVCWFGSLAATVYVVVHFVRKYW